MECLSPFGTGFVSYNAFAPTTVTVIRESMINTVATNALFFILYIPPCLTCKGQLVKLSFMHIVDFIHRDTSLYVRITYHCLMNINKTEKYLNSLKIE